MNDKDITITIKASAAQLQAAMKAAVKATNDATSKMKGGVDAVRAANDRLGDSFDNFRSKAATALKATGIAAVIGLGMAVTSAGDLQSSLSQLNQASGATNSEMRELTARAKQLGKDIDLPGVTASKAAEAMTELAKAGLSVRDVIDASKGVMSLAKAGNIEYAEAATIAASALNAFSMKGSDATKVADALAAGANASQADLSDLALGLQQSATVAKQFKLSLNENVTALALFANNGIKGSDAGTSLKTMLIALANPTDNAAGLMKELGFSAYDAKGKFVGLDEMSKRLRKSTANLTDQQKQAALATIFGTDAFRAASVLSDNAGDSYSRMAKSVGQVGAAQKAAAAQQGGYQKAIENFSNAMSDLGITVGEKLLPPVTDFINLAAQNIEPTFNFLSSNAMPIAIGIAAIGTAFATIRVAGFVSDLNKAKDVLTLIVGAKNANGIRAIGSAAVSAGSGVKAAALALKSLSLAAASNISIAAKMAAAWVVAAARVTAAMAASAARSAAVFVMMGVQALIAAARVAAAWVVAMGPIGWITAAVIALAALIIANWDTVQKWLIVFWSWLQNAASAAWSAIKVVFGAVGGWFRGVFQTAWNGIKNIFGTVGGFFRGVWNTIVGIFGKVGSSIGNAIGGAVKGVVNSILGFAENTINGFIKAINLAISAINLIPGVNIGKLGLLSIPRLETGAIVPATPGGRTITVAEGGQAEWVVPESKMASLVSQVLARTGGQNSGSGGSGDTKNVTINNEYNVKTQVDAQRIASDMGYLASQI